uniref:SGNH hydrolase-type esterase domain-containing protein n=1 Tax=Magallana gigas TaxID=29159 RepID=A0A8W8IA39_MAGGI
MPKRKPSQPQGDVHVEVEPRTNHGKRKKDRATMDVPQTSNLVPVEHAEGTNVLDSVSIETVGVTPTPINSIQFSLGHNVSESLRMKIVEGKYVDLALLLKNSNIEDTVSERVLVVGNDGQMVKLNLTSVWIVGSSIIKHAAIEARVRPGGTSLGLKSMGIELWWQGYGGLKFVDVAKKLRYLATLQDSPQFIVMHCGGNDLGQIPLSKLLYRVKWDIRLMASVFPDCQLVWSFILPRITWRYSQRPRCMEQARNRVNRLAAKEVLACGGRIIRHPQFIGKPQNLYSSDGVHLSKLGNYLFLNNIQGALEYFVRDGSSRHFPVS